MQFISSVVAFGLMMKDSEYRGSVSKDMILDLALNSDPYDPYGYKEEFISSVQNLD